jgi:alpha-tubulin suppressor-like RCC1 family protein
MKKITKAFIASFLIQVCITSSFGQCWKQVSAGNNVTLAIKNDGKLWAWRTTQGNNENQQSPIRINTDSNWKSISAGYYNNFAHKTNNSIWSCSINQGGLLGYGFEEGSFSIPIQVGIITDLKTFDADDDHIIYLKR